MRPNQWAATSVAAILKNGVLSVQSDKLFHGDAKATRSEAVIALAKMARKIESGEWKPGSGKPVSNKVLSIWEKTDWKTQPLRRYALAAVLNRFGDYVVKGLPKPKAGAKRLGASETLEQALKPQTSKPARSRRGSFFMGGMVMRAECAARP